MVRTLRFDGVPTSCRHVQRAVLSWPERSIWASVIEGREGGRTPRDAPIEV